MSREHKDLAPTVIFIGMSFGFEYLGFERLLPPISSSYLRDSYSTIIALVLGHYSKQAS